MDTLILSAPDFSTLDAFVGRKDPAVLWPVGPQSLAAHWLDHAVRLGCKRVVIHAVDRPAEVRTALGGGGYWSLQIEVSAQPASGGATPMLGLPGESPCDAPATRSALLNWWFELNARWLAGRNPDAVSIDRHAADGGWVAPGVKIHPSATMTAPYWIGTGAEIGPDCRIGPNALIGPGSLLENDVAVENSLVLGRTFLGRHLEVRALIVDGDGLLDRRAGTRCAIQDEFIVSPLAADSPPVRWSERLVAAILWLPAMVLAIGAGRSTCETVRLPGGGRLTLLTRARGSLLARRSDWLRHVLAGRMRLVGVLPRTTTPDLPHDSRRILEDAVPGAFALSDLHGIHTTANADEAVHAIFQVAMPTADRTVWRNLFRLCRLRPPSSIA